MNLDKYLFRQNIKKKVNFALIDNEIKQCYQILEEEHTILNGKVQAEIANFWGCSLRKVAYWCVHGDAENLESLVDETIKGNYQKVTENFHL